MTAPRRPRLQPQGRRRDSQILDLRSRRRTGVLHGEWLLVLGFSTGRALQLFNPAFIMKNQTPDASLQLRSVVTAEGQVVLSLVEEPVPALKAEKVLVRVEATPINPSDIGLMLGAADLSQAWTADCAGGPELVAPVPAESLKARQSRGDAPMRVGLEGAGTTVAAGSSHAAQSLMGRTVATMAGGMNARYRCIPAAECLVLPEGTSAAQAASCFVNPLAALEMIEAARSERHTAIVKLLLRQISDRSSFGFVLLTISRSSTLCDRSSKWDSCESRVHATFAIQAPTISENSSLTLLRPRERRLLSIPSVGAAGGRF